MVAGLQAGANDYVTKPFDHDELRAQVQVGRMVTDLQASLAERVRDVEAALTQVKQLQGLLPICTYCKKVHDDRNYWQQVEEYVCAASEVQFSHGICPDCSRRPGGAGVTAGRRTDDGVRSAAASSVRP